MSAALVRQALAFVDGEESVPSKKSKRGAGVRGSSGQDHPYKCKNKLPVKQAPKAKSKVELAEENIKKLLTLSKITTDTEITEKIVKRAIKGKPLLEKIEIKKEEEKSILFPEDDKPILKLDEEL